MPRRLKSTIVLEAPYACPCCGEDRPFGGKGRGQNLTFFGLRVGPDSASAECVQCYTCGLRMIVHHPDEFPLGTWIRGNIDQSLTNVQLYCQAEALRRWNRRTPKGEIACPVKALVTTPVKKKHARSSS